MAFDPALCASDPLARNAPEEPLTLVAVGGAGGGPQHEVVRRRGRDGIDQGLQSLLVDVEFLEINRTRQKVSYVYT